MIISFSAPKIWDEIFITSVSKNILQAIKPFRTIVTYSMHGQNNKSEEVNILKKFGDKICTLIFALPNKKGA
jgi:hypothetical protein